MYQEQNRLQGMRSFYLQQIQLLLLLLVCLSSVVAPSLARNDATHCANIKSLFSRVPGLLQAP